MDKNTFLIVGLGNPGKTYAWSRHNIGFIMTDSLQKEFGFSNWSKKEKLRGEISQGIILDKKVILLKPQTYMNNSGQSVRKTLSFYQIPIDNLFVINDDLDLLFPSIKIAEDRGSAGHKGVESIIQSLKTKNFTRLRIGIKPKRLLINPEKFVLDNFNIIEKRKVEKIKEEFIKIIETILKDGVQKAMNDFN
ncbi:MAG: aminoacyl-tRNA hydrolase [Candidatus Paceibacterota bacterium]|jgi:PTH1 family peptidyl-tRNA hydrolase